MYVYYYYLFHFRIRYKISDFGSSKNIENEEGEFMSLAGTEEYLVSL